MKVILVLLPFLQGQQSAIISCTGNFATAGCRSFQQMADQKDDDVIAKITPPLHAFVCFPPNMDKFVLVSFMQPSADRFKKNAQYDVWSAFGYLTMQTFKSGVEDDVRTAYGEWTSFDKTALQNPYFQSAEKSNTSATVNQSEIDISFSFQNISGGNTSRGLFIRRSTLRYRDSFKANVKDNGKDSPMSDEETGYCAEFK